MKNRWKTIKFSVLARRVAAEMPDRRRWRWQPITEKGRRRLQLVSPRGAVMDFRMNGGAQIKLHE